MSNVTWNNTTVTWSGVSAAWDGVSGGTGNVTWNNTTVTWDSISAAWDDDTTPPPDPSFGTFTVSDSAALVWSGFSSSSGGDVTGNVIWNNTAVTWNSIFVAWGSDVVIYDPPNLQVNVVASTAHLTWAASPTEHLTRYRIYRRSPPTGDPFDPEVDTPIAAVTTTSYQDSGLPMGEHEWQVIGVVGD